MKSTALAGMTVAWLAAGCAHASRVAQGDDLAVCPRFAVTVYVTSHKWTDVVIYVIHGSARDRLGRVPSLESAVFEIPASMLGSAGEIRVMAEPGSGEPFVTPIILIRPTRTVINLTIENYTAYSTVFVSTEAS